MINIKTLLFILLALILSAFACSINIDWGDTPPAPTIAPDAPATEAPPVELPTSTEDPAAAPTNTPVPGPTETTAPTFTQIPTLTSTNTAMPTPTPILSYLIDTGFYSDVNAAANYEIDAAYPMLNEAAYPGGALFNSAVDVLLQPIYSNFRTAAAGASPGPVGGTSTLDVSFEVKVSNHGYISILFTVSEYIAGAAHPNSVPKVINFDYVNQQLLLLGDIFSAGSAYLDRLSTYCTTNVSAIDWPAGAAPAAVNYQYWNISPASIMVSYEPYTVGPGAYGIVSCDIPYGNIADILTIPFP